MILLVQALSLVTFTRFHRTTVLRLAVLRQQLAVYKRSVKKPRLKNRDRLFWFVVLRVWKDCRSEWILVKPLTVIRWRKRKFREFWRKNSGSAIERPAIPRKYIDFIRHISSDHPEHRVDTEIKGAVRSEETVGSDPELHKPTRLCECVDT